MIVPQEIRKRRFRTGLRGYEPAEIEEFQERLAFDFEELYSSNEKLKQRLGQLRSQITALRENELGMKRIQEITSHQSTLTEASALREAQELLSATLPHVEQRIRGHQEVLQRIKLLTEEAHMLWGIQSDPSFPAGLDGQMDILSQQVQELVGDLEEFEKIFEAQLPANKLLAPTVESLMAFANGELDSPMVSTSSGEPVFQPASPKEGFPWPSADSEAKLVLTEAKQELEMKDALITNALSIVEGKPNNGIEYREKGKSKNVATKKKAADDSTKNRLVWALIFIVVIISGFSGGYFFSNYLDKLPPIFSNSNPSGVDNEYISASPLLAAVIANDIDQVKVLLNSGESIKTMTLQGETPLMIAAYQGNVELVEVLLQAGADTDLQSSEWGGTALMYGAFQGHLEIVELLVKNHADLDIKNKNGWTALMAAAYAGRPQTARFLVTEGADPYLENSDGLNAYQLAVLAGRDLTAQNLKQAGVAESEILGNGKDGENSESDSAAAFSKDPILLKMFSMSVGP